jgi:tripartite-type tricarboxylate transporter receptor subunit TctC
MPHIEAGNLRALAVTTRERLPHLPDTPTVAESGYPDYRAVAWFGVAVPKGVPAEIAQRLTVELDRVLTDEDFRGSLEKLAYVVHRPRDAAGISSFVKEDHDRWSRLIARQGITLE